MEGTEYWSLWAFHEKMGVRRHLSSRLSIKFTVACLGLPVDGSPLSQEIVIERSKPHVVSIRLSILLVMLGMCVFLWGFGYKLSLYDLHPLTVHRIPEAKLLSKNEDARAVDGVRQALASTDSVDRLQAMSLIAVVIAVPGPCVPGMNFERDRSGAADPPSAFPSAALYFRPPPVPTVS